MYKVFFQKHGCPLVEERVFQTNNEKLLWLGKMFESLCFCRIIEVFH